MCGICGYISKQHIGKETLTRLNDTMYHRGPNDSGVEVYQGNEGYEIGLAQRRLSILDLSPLGHQPMSSPDNRVTVVYNGEIYNYLELKKELNGYPFKSTCDTEVILAGYLKWGIDFVNKINGMFAIALYDQETDKLYLVRDRVGKKPLYYWYEDGNIMFASELKPLLEYEKFPRRIRKDILWRYLYQHYINSPDSVFENVFQVMPGAVVEYKKSEIKTWKYWDVATVYNEKKGTGPKDYYEAKEELNKILKKSVEQRMIADVPLGTFLSGGYDSSLISGIASSISDTPVRTFSVGFEDEKYNEAKYAREVARHLGTNHTEVIISEKDMLDLVESIPFYYDEPFADNSQIATMLVSKVARDSVTVALSGDGGDEFFCGYNVYSKIAEAKKLDALGAIAHAIGKIGNLEAHYPFKVKAISQNRIKNAKTQFVYGNYYDVTKSMINKELSQKIPYYDFEDKYGEKNWQEIRMLLDMDTYLPGDILTKVDRASMKYSLESRCPILDKNVIEFAFSIPHEFKFKDGNKKRILKDLAYDYIPKELLERPKVGFSVPLDKWLRGPLKEQLLSYTDKKLLVEQGLFNTEYIQSFVKSYLETGDGGSGTGENYSRIIWAYFVFQQWMEKWGSIHTYLS